MTIFTKKPNHTGSNAFEIPNFNSTSAPTLASCVQPSSFSNDDDFQKRFKSARKTDSGVFTDENFPNTRSFSQGSAFFAAVLSKIKSRRASSSTAPQPASDVNDVLKERSSSRKSSFLSVLNQFKPAREPAQLTPSQLKLGLYQRLKKAASCSLKTLLSKLKPTRSKAAGKPRRTQRELYELVVATRERRFQERIGSWIDTVLASEDQEGETVFQHGGYGDEYYEDPDEDWRSPSELFDLNDDD